jgi:hypothetical protein
MLFKNNTIVKNPKDILNKCIKLENYDEYYVLNPENAIVVKKNKENNNYTMTHVILTDGNLIKINEWTLNSYFFNYPKSDVTIKELGLFLVQGKYGKLNAVYDYQNWKFIIPQNEWDYLSFEFMDKYHGFLGYFNLNSTKEDNDTFIHTNQITNEKVIKSFGIVDGTYYGLVNFDGTIRGNKLFKGNTFSEIEEIIDLDNYDSLEAFKQERIDMCNKRKNKLKEEFYSKINNGVSIYLEKEVENILKLNK